MTEEKTSTITVLEMLVESDSTGHYLDSELNTGLQNQMNDHQELEETHKNVAAGNHTLEGIDAGAIKGTVTDQPKQHHVKFSGIIVPGLGHHLFSVFAAASMGAVLFSTQPNLG